MLIILASLFGLIALAQPCDPNQIYIREQRIQSYSKSDGTLVKNHIRKSHCRFIEKKQFFADSTKQKFKTLSPTLKKWNPSEKELVQKHIAFLPPWLSKYSLQEILRSVIGENVKNPATTIPATRTIIIHDQFFREQDQRGVIIHEFCHIAFASIDPIQFIEFSIASGWKVGQNFLPVPPARLLKQDSSHSIEEDLANHIET